MRFLALIVFVICIFVTNGLKIGVARKPTSNRRLKRLSLPVPVQENLDMFGTMPSSGNLRLRKDYSFHQPEFHKMPPHIQHLVKKYGSVDKIPPKHLRHSLNKVREALKKAKLF
tara:strand:+ start:175 stop:516 length:342 start_codon:yes stop_codon:yes gene_type:complete